MRIVTHSGPFHADDVIAVALVSEYCAVLNRTVELNRQIELPEIIRTRDQVILDEGVKDVSTFMVDVGGIHNPHLSNFDHHFVGSPLRHNGQPYASAGLVAKAIYPPFFPALDQLCLRVDLADNGIQQPGWTLSMTVHKCNPIGGGGAEEFDRRFKYLVELAVRELVEGLLYKDYSIEFAIARFEADVQVVEWVEEYNKAITESEIRVREAFLQEGPFVVLKQYEPALLELAHLAPEGKFYTIFPNPGGEWMVQQIPTAHLSQKGRKPLPEEWAGKRGEDLDTLTGLQGCVFCHSARFIGGHKTLDGAVRMAELALSP